MSNKMVFGALITIIGLVFTSLTLIYAELHPWDWNGIDGLLGSLIGTKMLIPLIIAIGVMIRGLVICYKEAYKDK